MKYTLLILILFFFGAIAIAQQQPEKGLRIVDTLTAQEKATRNPILTRLELDSIVKANTIANPAGESDLEKNAAASEFDLSSPLVIGGGIFLLIIVALLVLILKRQKQAIRASYSTRKEVKELARGLVPSDNGSSDKQVRQRAALEKKIEELSAELEKQKQANRIALEDYQAIKESIATVYKVRNYPGYEKQKGDGQLVKELLLTEKSVALYAFDKFLKPLIAIADANKNNPARMSKDDSEKIFDLLVSLSLFYIEYLYLRIEELSVGGNIVERISSHAKGNGIDQSLLKTLNTDHGSRALALRLALDKKGIGKLSYPVFDETNLNNA